MDGTDEADIASANSSTYILGDADLGTTLKVRVTFDDDLGHTETLTSAATATVTVAADTTPPEVVSVTVPISGSEVELVFDEDLDETVVGNLLASVFSLTVAGQAVTIPDYAMRNAALFLYVQTGTIKQGQTVVVSYTDPTAGDDTVALQDIAGNDVASFTTGMSGVPAVTNNSTVSVNTPATGAPTITGTAQVGETLTASTTGIADANGLTTPAYTYQWIRVNGTEADIAGENSSTYTLVAADLGTTLKVKVSFTDDASNSETLTSAAYPSSGTVTTASTTAPALTSVTVTSTPRKTTDTYGAREHIEFSMTFDAPVTVTGDPTFAFDLGGATTATYYAGSGTATLRFSHAVSGGSSGDEDTNGISWAANAIALNGGTIAGTDNAVAAVLTHVAQSNLAGHKVDGRTTAVTPATVTDVVVTSTPTSLADTYGFGETIVITVTVSEAVEVEGDPVFRFSLTNPGSAANNPQATYDRTRSIVFTYTVQAGDMDNNGIWIGTHSQTFLLDANDRIRTASQQIDIDLSHPEKGTHADGDRGAVVLNTQPTANVTVTVAGHAGTDVTPSPTSLTFTTTTWGTAQTVTVTAGDDADTANDAVTLTHSAASTDTDYDGISIDGVAVTVNDNDTAPATGAPTITGTAQVGQTLTAVTTGIMDADGLTSPTYTYQWIRVDGTDEADIASANSSTYILGDADLGTTLKVRVTFDDDLGHTETLTSAATATVGAVATGPPTVTDVAVTSTPASGTTYYLADEVIEFTVTFSAPVTVTATPKFAFRLGAATRQAAYASGSDSAALVFARTVQAGEVDRNGISWNAIALALDGGTITRMGATTAARLTHAEQAPLEGHRVDAAPPMQVSASVQGLALVLVYDEPLDPASMPATGAYTVTATVGATTTNPAVSEVSIYGIWVTLTLDAPPAAGATVTLAYAPPASNPVQDEAGNDAPAFSGQKVNGAAGNTAPTGAPTITGTAQVGQTLTASTTGIADADGLTSPTYTYQWIRVNGTEADIAGENSSTYILVDADLDTTLKVRVTFADDLGHTETLTSAATATVVAVATAALGQVMGVGVAPGNAQLVVTWTAVSTATGYTVQWTSGSQGYTTGDRQATVTSGSPTRYTIPSLINGTEYTVRVIATRTGATDGPPSEEMTGTPRVPPPPPPPVTDLAQVMGVGVAPGNAQLVVTWTAVDTATGYTVQWTSGGEDYNTGDRQATVTSGSPTRYTIPSLINGTEYTVRVIATRTGADDGPPSAEETGTPRVPPPPPPPPVTDLGQVMGVGVAPGNAQPGGDLDGGGHRHGLHGAVDVGRRRLQHRRPAGHGHVGVAHALHDSQPYQRHGIHGAGDRAQDGRHRRPALGGDDGDAESAATAAAAGDGPCAGAGGGGRPGQRAAGGDLDGGGHRHGLHGAVDVGRRRLQHRRPAGHGHVGVAHALHDSQPHQRHGIHGAGDRDPDGRHRRPTVGGGDGNARHHARRAAAPAVGAGRHGGDAALGRPGE